MESQTTVQQEGETPVSGVAHSDVSSSIATVTQQLAQLALENRQFMSNTNEAIHSLKQQMVEITTFSTNSAFSSVSPQNQQYQPFAFQQPPTVQNVPVGVMPTIGEQQQSSVNTSNDTQPMSFASNNVQIPQYPQQQQYGQLPPPPNTVDIRRRDSLLRHSPSFYGRAYEDMDLFLVSLKRYFIGTGINTPREQYDILLWSLKDKAQAFAQSLCPIPDTFTSLEVRLRRRYSKTMRQKIDALDKLKQSASQDIGTYGDLVRTTSMGTNMTEDLVIHKFLYSLNDRRLLPYLAVQNFQVLEDAVQAAQLLQSSLRPSSFSNPSSSYKSTRVPLKESPDSKKAGKCFKCGKPGHISRNCPKSKKKDSQSAEVCYEEEWEGQEEEGEEEMMQSEPYPSDTIEEGESDSDDVEDIQELEVCVVEVCQNSIEVNSASKRKEKDKLYQKLAPTKGLDKKNKPSNDPPKGKEVKMKTHLPKPLPGAFLEQPPQTLSNPQRPAISVTQQPLPQKPLRPSISAPSSKPFAYGNVVPPKNAPTKKQYQSKAPSQTQMSSPSVDSRAHVFVPPVRTAVFPNVTKATRTRPQVSDGSKALSAPVSLPLKAQIGLLCLSAKKPQKFVDHCINAANQLLNELDVNVVDVCQSSYTPIPPPKQRQTLYIKLLIDDKPCYGLIDTGAQISLITSALVNHLGLIRQDSSNLTPDGYDIVGVNDQPSTTNRLLVTMMIGSSGGHRRSFAQRLHVIHGISYKLILGQDLLYFWGAEISIPKQLLTITRSPVMQLPLYPKRTIISTPEFLNFSQASAEVSLAEVYEINTVARIANTLAEPVQSYLKQELCEVLTGNVPSGQYDCSDTKLPINSRVSFQPLLPHSLSTPESRYDLTTSLAFCKENGLDPTDQSTLQLRVSRVTRALVENPLIINKELPAQEYRALLQVILDFADILAFSLQDLSETADFPPMRIEVTSKPIRSKPYRLTRQDQQLVDSEVEQLKAANMLRDSRSPWLSPTFVVRPSTHRARMVTDYRRLNAVTIKNAYPLPDILQLFDKLADSEYFTTLDLKSGFYQIAVDPESQPITAMGTDNGLFEFKVVPFGLANAPSHFMHAINHVRQVEKLSQFCQAFVDDLCVHSPSFSDHPSHLRQVLGAMKKRRHMLAATKMFAGYTAIKLLGHFISSKSIHMDPEKVSAIQKLLPPSSIKELRAFLGIVGYYRRFISNFAKRSFSLTQQLKQDGSFLWNQDCQTEFEDLKSVMMESPILALPNAQGRFRLYTDYCSYAISAILHQVQDSKEKVIQYASKKCQPREAVLPSAEGELLAVIFGLSKFRHYLAGTNFDLLTDSAAVTNLRSTRNLNAKLVRWSLLISDFDFVLIHKSGKTHTNADGLSRAPTSANDYDEVLVDVDAWEVQTDWDKDSDASDSSEMEIDLCSASIQPLERSICDTGLALEKLNCICQKCSLSDQRKKLLCCETCGSQWHPHCIQQQKPSHFYWHCPDCQHRISQQGMIDLTEHEILQSYLAGKRSLTKAQEDEILPFIPHYSWSRGLLYKINNEGEARIFPGPARRLAIIDELHRRYLHMGSSRLASIAEETFHWPGLRQQICDYVAHCLPCQMSNLVFRRRERLQGHLLPISAPRQGWSIDLAPELNTIQGDKASIIISVDDFSGFVCLGIVDKKSRNTGVWMEQNIIHVFGTPQYVRTDQGSEFGGSFHNICVKYGVIHKYVERAAPWRNGRAERMVRTVKRMITAVITARESDDWPQLLPQLAMAINSAPTKGTRMSAFEVFFGEKPPSLIKTHEISGQRTCLLQQPPSLDQQSSFVQHIQEKRSAVQELAKARLQEYHSQLEEQYAAYPIKENAKTRDPSSKLLPNSLVAIKNTQRGAWQTTGVGPFLIVDVTENNVRLQSLTTGQIFVEAKENVLPLNMRSGPRARVLQQLSL